MSEFWSSEDEFVKKRLSDLPDIFNHQDKYIDRELPSKFTSTTGDFRSQGFACLWIFVFTPQVKLLYKSNIEQDIHEVDELKHEDFWD